MVDDPRQDAPGTRPSLGRRGVCVSYAPLHQLKAATASSAE